MIKLIMVVLSAFFLLLCFCDETNNPSPVGPTDPVKKDTSILIGTWAQVFDTSTAKKKEYWLAFPGTNDYGSPDTSYYLNDSIEMDYYIDQTGKRYKDSSFYFYRNDTVWSYTKDEINSGIDIKGDTTWSTFKMVNDSILIFGGDTIGSYYKL